MIGLTEQARDAVRDPLSRSGEGTREPAGWHWAQEDDVTWKR